MTAKGIKIIPTLTWGDERSFDFCFRDLPKGGTYITSTVGIVNDELGYKLWHDGMKYAEKMLKPKRILHYGKDIDYKYSCEVVYFKTNTAFGSKG